LRVTWRVSAGLPIATNNQPLSQGGWFLFALTAQNRKTLVYGAAFSADGQIRVLPDWQLLKTLNSLSAHSLKAMPETFTGSPLVTDSRLEEAGALALETALASGESFTAPDTSLVALLNPK
jgi:hypothetical protein